MCKAGEEKIIIITAEKGVREKNLNSQSPHPQRAQERPLALKSPGWGEKGVRLTPFHLVCSTQKNLLILCACPNSTQPQSRRPTMQKTGSSLSTRMRCQPSKQRMTRQESRLLGSKAWPSTSEPRISAAPVLASKYSAVHGACLMSKSWVS